MWGVGKPERAPSNDSTTIGWVDPTGPAWKAGLRPGDKVLEIDGYEVTHFLSPAQDSITWRIVTSEGTNIVIKYLRDGREDGGGDAAASVRRGGMSGRRCGRC